MQRHFGAIFTIATLAFGVLFVLPALSAADDASTTPATDTSGSGAAISTGDASAGASSENDVNTDVTQALPADEASSTASTTAPGDSDASSTPPSDTASTTPADASSTPLAQTDQNAATTSSDTLAGAGTGGNTATSTVGPSFIATGDAYAHATSVNVINTNIVDSAGLFYFADLFSALGIDLRDLDLSYFAASSTPAASPLSLTTDNAATTTSSTTAIAVTGDNVARSNAGGASISTGDAYASANSVNVVNTNIVNSNYLLVALNDFGSLTGDLTLPGAAFFESLLSRSDAPASTSVSTDNSATVSSDTSAAADSGGNAASSTDPATATSTGAGASVVSGSAVSSATTLTQANTNQVGGTTVFLLFRIFGTFSGAIQGLPAGLSWEQTPAGLLITNAAGAPADPSALAGPAVSASTTNSASLLSSAHAYALTGGNEAQGASAAVSSGNAYAAANSVNVVNSNLIGTNWIYAIFNIFGDMGGAIAFGHPDLWVGTSADAPTPTLPGSAVTYRATVANRGDAEATGINLAVTYPPGMLSFDGGTSAAGKTVFTLGDLAPGASEDVTYQATAGSVPAGHAVPVSLVATVSSDETDDNTTDNSDSLSLVLTTPGGSSTSKITYGAGTPPDLSVTQTADTAATTSPATVAYSADIYNAGGTAHDAQATDVVTAPDGSVVSTKTWALDDINYEDEIMITYDTRFATSSAPGLYKNVLTVGPVDASATPAFAPVSAETDLTLAAPAVLGAATCAPYLTSYLTPGGKDDPTEVALLQRFLVSHGSPNLPETGRYDFATQNAVKRFQSEYGSDILAPWGAPTPTGSVYYTTEAKINELACGDGTTFALTSAQEAEIAGSRALLALGQAGKLKKRAVAVAAAPLETVPPPEPPETEVPETPRAQGSWLARLLRAQASVMANILALFAPSANAAGSD